MEQLFNYINRLSESGVSAEDFEIIRQYFIPKRLRRKQYFLQEGEVCKSFGFIIKGAMRQYTVDDKGGEHIVQLAIEDWWVGDRESYIMFTPSAYNIDAWEDTELLTITRADVLELTGKCPAFVATLKVMDDRNHIANQRRITSAISASADKRYADFVDCNPSLMGRFPQHLIASYLGLSKDTLSRVKSKLK